MSLADRTAVLDELPLVAMLVSLFVATFLIGAIVGAEAMAAGEPRFPPALLPGLVWGGEATDKFVSVYQTTTSALWACALAVVGTTAVAEYRRR